MPNIKQISKTVRVWELIPPAYGGRWANLPVLDLVSFQHLHKGSICNHQAYGGERRRGSLKLWQKYLLKNEIPFVQVQKIRDPLCMPCSLDKLHSIRKQHSADAEQTRKMLTSSLVNLAAAQSHEEASLGMVAKSISACSVWLKRLI